MVKSFCCFRLHTAAVVIGWFGAIFSFFNIASYAFVITRVDDIINHLNGTNATSNGTDPNDIPIDPETMKIMISLILGIYLLINVINCVASCLLIAGTIQEKYLMIIPWLVNSGISIAYNFMNIIGVVVFYIVNHAPFATVFLIVLSGGIVIGFYGYAWLAMHSHMQNLRMQGERERLIPNKAGSAYPSYTRI